MGRGRDGEGEGRRKDSSVGQRDSDRESRVLAEQHDISGHFGVGSGEKREGGRGRRGDGEGSGEGGGRGEAGDGGGRGRGEEAIGEGEVDNGRDDRRSGNDAREVDCGALS